MPDRVPRVLVTDAGRGSAIAIIRSLGRRGWHVIAADSTARSLGFRSRYVSDRLVYPAPETEAESSVAALLDAARLAPLDLIVPVTDSLILPLSAARARFPDQCKLAIPHAAALDVVTDKWKTLDLATRLRVPAPRTYLASTVEQAFACVSDLGWPVVLKPQVSRRYDPRRGVAAFRVTYADNRQRLATEMQRFEGRCSVLVQEYTPGEGFGVELLMDRGRPLAAFQHRRLRELPIDGGPSAFRESAPLDPEMYGYAVHLLASLEWSGLAMVEFKRSDRGPMLMEINGRVWGSLPLAIRCGIDFPLRWAEMLLFGPPAPCEPLRDYPIGVRSRNLELDLMWIASVLAGRCRHPFIMKPRRRDGVAALASLFDPRNKFDIQSWDDPKPGWAEIPRIFHKFLAKMRYQEV